MIAVPNVASNSGSGRSNPVPRTHAVNGRKPVKGSVAGVRRYQTCFFLVRLPDTTELTR